MFINFDMCAELFCHHSLPPLIVNYFYFCRPELLLECLVNPIPRIIYDSVIKYSDINQLLKTLQERKEARQAVNTGRKPQYNEMPQSLKNVCIQISFGVWIVFFF